MTSCHAWMSLYFVHFDPVDSSYLRLTFLELLLFPIIYVLGRDCLNEDSLNICFRNMPCLVWTLNANEHLIQQNVQEKYPAAHIRSIFKREKTGETDWWSSTRTLFLAQKNKILKSWLTYGKCLRLEATNTAKAASALSFVTLVMDLMAILEFVHGTIHAKQPVLTMWYTDSGIPTFFWSCKCLAMKT